MVDSPVDENEHAGLTFFTENTTVQERAGTFETG